MMADSLIPLNSTRSTLAKPAPVGTMNGMLIPQFSIRWILGLTTVCALLALLAHAAIRGQIWAGAVVTGIAFLIFLMVVQAACFAGVWLFAQALPKREKPSNRSVDQVSLSAASHDEEA